MITMTAATTTFAAVAVLLLSVTTTSADDNDLFASTYDMGRLLEAEIRFVEALKNVSTTDEKFRDKFRDFLDKFYSDFNPGVTTFQFFSWHVIIHAKSGMIPYPWPLGEGHCCTGKVFAFTQRPLVESWHKQCSNVPWQECCLEYGTTQQHPLPEKSTLALNSRVAIGSKLHSAWQGCSTYKSFTEVFQYFSIGSG